MACEGGGDLLRHRQHEPPGILGDISYHRMVEPLLAAVIIRNGGLIHPRLPGKHSGGGAFEPVGAEYFQPGLDESVPGVFFAGFGGIGVHRFSFI